MPTEARCLQPLVCLQWEMHPHYTHQWTREEDRGRIERQNDCPGTCSGSPVSGSCGRQRYSLHLRAMGSAVCSTPWAWCRAELTSTTHCPPPGGATVTNSSESPPSLTFPGVEGDWSGTAPVPIVWEEPEGEGVSSYSIEHFMDGKQRETTTVFYNTTYYMATVEMGEPSNCFVVTAHTLNDTELVVGKGCTSASELWE